MHGRALLAPVAAALLVGAAPPPAPQSVSSFAWLSGTWSARDEQGWTEERWAPPRGGVMLGTSLSGRGGTAASYEFMRIAADAEGRIAFWASPGGQPPVRFALVAASRFGAVFENPANDYPTRIEYRRSGNVLVATISGAGGANPRIWRYRRTG